MCEITKQIWDFLRPLITAHLYLAGWAIVLIASVLVGWGIRRFVVRRRANKRLEELASDPRQDRAIHSKKNDALDRGQFVSSLARAVVRTQLDGQGNVVSREATGFVIGLTGAWGSGKSSILNLLHGELRATPGVAVAVLNPWLFKDREELLKAYFNSLREAVGTSSDEKIRSLLIYIDRYRKAIDWLGTRSAAVLDSAGLFGGLGTAIWAKISKVLSSIRPKPARSPEEERKALEQKLALLNVAVVVLIDELDRVEDSEVRAVAQLIKAVGDIRGVSYVVAYDPARVADALGRGATVEERRLSGEKYLEKIIQLPIPVRPLFLNDVDALFHAALQDFEITIPPPADDNQQAILAKLKASTETAREVKRLVGAFSVFEETVRGEISPYDILGYSWLLTKSEAVKEQIVKNVERLVDDPDGSELIERASRSREKPTVESILGPAAKPYEPLLNLMFPRFGADRRAGGAHDRVSRRRNLIRLLYLGNPPGVVGRSDIERVWYLDGIAEVEAELHRIQATGVLPQFLDVLDDLLPALSEKHDKTFWVGLSRLFYRRADWINEADSNGSLAEDAASSLMRLGTRERPLVPRARKALFDLRDAGDMSLVPWILRKHMFGYGLTKHGPARGGEMLLTEGETSTLLESEALRYRTAVLTGEALRRLPNMEVIYVLSNSNRWDDSLRGSLTAQLDCIEALGTFAALLVPPGYSTDRQHLDEMVDAAQVETALNRELGARGWPQDPWITNSLQRLRRLLQGKDLWADDDESLNGAPAPVIGQVEAAAQL